MSTDTSSTPLHVTIVGAGLAGLASAISLSLATETLQSVQRPKILILDSLPSLSTPGAGLQLTPNATRLLSRWSLLPQIEAVCAEPTKLLVHRYSDGKVLACDERFNERIRSRYDGFPFLDVHRGDLQRALYDRAIELGVEVRFDSKVADVKYAGDITTGRSVQVTTNGGETIKTSLLVGADGIWSKTREALLGHPDPPLPTGDLAYRIVLPLSTLTNDPTLHAFVSQPQCHFWIGPQSHVVGYSMRSGSERMYNLVLLCPDDLPADVARAEGDLPEMRKLFEGWDPILTKFLGKVQKVDKWKLMHRPEMERWVGGEGRVVLVGDSCHPMLPYLAQGANSALEDGAVLGWCLGRVKGASDREGLTAALELYETVRKERGERVARETFKQVSDEALESRTDDRK